METASSALSELRNVRRTYTRGGTVVHALDDASLRVEEGEFLAIMGASGSGKSTCLNILGCLDAPTKGQHLFRGVDVGCLGDAARTRLRRDFLGFVFQGFNLLPRATALENVELPLVYRGVKGRERKRLAWHALESVGLHDRTGHTPAELSGGQQQRVAIARAVVTNPRLILADEPTGNLDSRRKGDVMRLLCELNRRTGIAVVMVTHEPEMAAYADRVVVFRDGRVQWRGAGP